MTNVKQRLLRAAGLAAVVAITATGCGTSPQAQDQPELSNEPVTLSMNWWGADARIQKTNQAIELFEKKYPNISVEPQYSDWNGYWDRLATSTAGGDMPDVMQFDQLYLASYADRGTLLDLKTVSNTLDLSAVPEGVLQSGLVDGTQYALPLGGTPNATIVNKTLLDKYGIAMPDFETWTWGDFSRIGNEISKKAGGEAWGIGPLGADTFGLTMWARQHGENLYNETGDVAVKPETITSLWNQSLDWIESGAAPSVEHINERTGLPLDQTDLTLGKIAMTFIPAGQLSAYQAAAPDFEFVLGKWPKAKDAKEGFQYLKPSMYWAASSKTEHPAEAALLMNFLTTDPEVAKIFGTDRGIPANPAAQEAIAPSLDAVGKQILDFTAEATTEVGTAPPITPNGASDSETILSRYYQKVLVEELTPQDAAERFIKDLQSSIDTAK